MAVPTPKSVAKKRKMRLKRLQLPSAPTPSSPSAVNDHEVHNKNNSCPLRLKTNNNRVLLE